MHAQDFEITRLPVDALTKATRRASLELFDSVRRFGVWHPLVVVRVKAGTPPSLEHTYQVQDGQRRLDAARRAGMDSVPVLLATSENVDAVREAVLQLHFTRSPSRATEYMEIIKMRGDPRTIAEALHIPVTKVLKYQRLSLLPAPIHRAFCEGGLSWAIAQQVAQLSALARTRLTEVWERKGKITSDDIRDAQQIKKDEVARGMPSVIFDGPTETSLDIVTLNTGDAERLADLLDRLPEIDHKGLAFARETARTLRGIDS